MIIDNRTKFVGAEREFAKYIAAGNKEGIQSGISWKHNRRISA